MAKSRLARHVALAGLVGLSSAITAPVAAAFSQCGFDDAPGDLIRFIELDMADRQRNRTSGAPLDSYPDWVAKIGDNPGVNGHLYFARFARLMPEAAVTRGEGDAAVRYYPALVENCDRIYLRVAASDRRFTDHFTPADGRFTGHLPLASLEHAFNIRFERNVEHFRAKLNQSLAIAQIDGLPILLDGGKKVARVPHWDRIVLRGIDDRPFVEGRRVTASFGLRVELASGARGVMPGRIQAYHSQEALKTVDAKRLEVISTGRIEPGMSHQEVFLAWGQADTVRQFPVVRHADGGIETVYGDTPGPVDAGEVIGIESHWYYRGRLGDEPLIFNNDGALEEKLQYPAVLAAIRGNKD